MIVTDDSRPGVWMRVLAASLLVVTVSGCLPQTRYPLTADAQPSTAKAIIGEWQLVNNEETAFMMILERSDGWADVVTLSVSESGAQDDDWQALRIFTSRINGNTYANAKLITTNDQSPGEDFDLAALPPQGPFVPLHYELTDDAQLSIAPMHTDAAVDLVLSGVPGNIERGKYLTSVLITADSETLADAVAATTPAKLFATERVRFLRRSPRQEADFAANDWRIAAAMSDYASVLEKRDHFADAAGIFSAVITIYERRLGESARLGAELLRYADLLRRAGRDQEAARHERRGHEMYAAGKRMAPASPAPEPEQQGNPDQTRDH